jgi:DNA-binding CsgD family transcriptional regulator
VWAGESGGVLAAAQAARASPPGRGPVGAVDVVLEALATRLTDGYAAAAPALTRALGLLLRRDDAAGRSLWLAGSRPSALVALELWDDESWFILVERLTRAARETGALAHLRVALHHIAIARLREGDLTRAAAMLEEDRLIAEATGNAPVPYSEMLLAAWRGREPEASGLIDSTLHEARARGLGADWIRRVMPDLHIARSVLYNGLGRHDAARDAAWRAFEPDYIGRGIHVVPELAEAASRTGDDTLVGAALEWLSERTRVTPTDWSLGIEARIRALLSEGDVADGLYRESIDRLGGTRLRVELARAHLLYGEWLRREQRRVDARYQLRTAHDMLDAMGVEAFAERARRELRATGESVRRRTVETRDELTAQEAQIARLAAEGLSNPEIGARMFISRRTVEYHLHKVFGKLEISSRNQLHLVLASDRSTVPRVGPKAAQED